MQWLVTSWYSPSPIRWLLAPLSALYFGIIWLRKQLYNIGLFKQVTLAAPVIIVGNITVGGTGKTPTVIWLAQQLKQAGFQPGIISRGYGGQASYYPFMVSPDSLASEVGDEPLLLSQRTQCPVVIGPNRAEVGQYLLDNTNCNIIISDDGLQHYALQRDIELIVVDGQRLFGNGYCLPAGPLREPLSRLKGSEFIIYNGDVQLNKYTLTLHQTDAVNLLDASIRKPLSEFKQSVHAVAAIGNPQRFFTQLNQQGLTLIEHPFADHHPLQSDELNFNDDLAILMTEKDAVKCQHLANTNMWVVPVESSISGDLEQHLLNKLAGLNSHG